jgi:hypothetical protein
MNRFSLISLAAVAAAAVLATTPVLAAQGAGEGTPGYPHELAAAASTTSRADVRADAVKAVAEGRVASGEIGLKPAQSVVGQPAILALTRAEVRAEAVEAVRLGLVASGETSVVYTAPQLASIKAAGERASRIVVAGQR